jgi:asparagine synthase (glutamine-hydrolysing)
VNARTALGVPLRWDRESLFDVHYGLMTAPSRTTFDGVFQVPPGCYLLTDGAHVHVHQYWDFNYPAAADVRSRPAEEYVAEFRHELEEAVRLRLRADVPVGCYLSGGLDSCAVIGLAARHHPDPIRAFTLTFDRPDYDEEKEAREMAVRVGAEFHPSIGQDGGRTSPPMVPGWAFCVHATASRSTSYAPFQAG